MRYLLLLNLWLLATGCATWEATLASPLDSTVRQQLHVRRVKFKGPVIIQVGGTGNTATATATDARKASAPIATGAGPAQDYTKAGQHGGALVTAPGSSAGATTRTGVSNTTILVGIIVMVILLLLGLAYRYRAKLPNLLKIGV